MEYRELGRTGYRVSTISFGAWAIGGSWGDVDDRDSLAALHRALDLGVNFFDTADVYGDGRSERLIARLRRERSEPFYVATKAGRRLDPHVAAGYNRANLTAFVERSLKNLEVEALDLVQLHCPPTEVYDSDEVFGVLDDLVAAGKLRHYGVSVELVSDAKATSPSIRSSVGHTGHFVAAFALNPPRYKVFVFGVAHGLFTPDLKPPVSRLKQFTRDNGRHRNSDPLFAGALPQAALTDMPVAEVVKRFCSRTENPFGSVGGARETAGKRNRIGMRFLSRRA